MSADCDCGFCQLSRRLERKTLRMLYLVAFLSGAFATTIWWAVR